MRNARVKHLTNMVKIHHESFQEYGMVYESYKRSNFDGGDAVSKSGQ